MKSCYLIRLPPESFGQQLACLGMQLSRIVRLLEGDVIWYGADVSSNNASVNSALPHGRRPELIGNTDRLVELLKGIDQLLSGVFLAVDKDSIPSWTHDYFTHSKVEFREMDQAKLEIRAFDTSFYEIYSVGMSVLEPVVLAFRIPRSKVMSG